MPRSWRRCADWHLEAAASSSSHVTPPMLANPHGSARRKVKLGVIPGAGGTQRLVHAIGKAKVMRLLLSGEPVEARWAHDAGLVADVVDDETVLDRALELANQIARNAPRAVLLAADSARRVPEAPLRQALAHERRNFLLALATADAQEGVAAFTERRTPNFTGK